MIQSLALLLSCQLAGEIVSRGLGLPVPGPVLGLILLFVLLRLFGPGRGLEGAALDGSEIGRTANSLLQALALFFVPAGAGIVQHAGLLGEHGLTLLAAVFGSTVLALVATVGAFRFVKRMTGDGEEAGT
jgi:putative effector of murein hydrolase LrgA (UPF0299 family)